MDAGPPPKGARWVRLEPYRGPWPDDDKDANFKQEVAGYSVQDPLVTLERMSRNMDVPLGALVRYVLVKWAASGSEALLAMGPVVARQMQALVDEAESAGTDAARLEAYRSLKQVVSWLQLPLEGRG